MAFAVPPPLATVTRTRSSQSCIECSNGFTLASNGLCRAQLRISNCVQVNRAAGTCSLCNAGYYISGNACAKASSLCDGFDRFGFDYAFASATDYYASGRFDTALLRMLACHDEVRDVILPTLGPARKATYSPFLPVCPRTGKVLPTPMHSLCVHGDTPGAVEHARHLRAALEADGWRMVRLDEALSG